MTFEVQTCKISFGKHTKTRTSQLRQTDSILIHQKQAMSNTGKKIQFLRVSRLVVRMGKSRRVERLKSVLPAFESSPGVHGLWFPGPKLWSAQATLRSTFWQTICCTAANCWSSTCEAMLWPLSSMNWLWTVCSSMVVNLARPAKRRRRLICSSQPFFHKVNISGKESCFV